MSKIENAFKILFLLREHGMLTSNEISKILGVTERQIQKYVSDMRKAGINIKSKLGSTGGYWIEECPFCKEKIVNLKED